MSAAQPLAVEHQGRSKELPDESCTSRVLILIDIARLTAAAGTEKRANGGGSRPASTPTAAATAGVVDGLRLAVLRVLTQLCLSCPLNSWVEWAPRFFDSRHGGVGKTPAELKARLRTRQAAQGVRGFRRVTQASFRAFGDACLAIACGIEGDPLARDRNTALRRWAHGQKKHSTKWTQSHRSEPGAGAGVPAAPADVEDSIEDITMCMYDGHDMSSHEVVVRSLLEVLQEFDDASDGDRTAAPSMARATSGRHNQKLQLLLLHSAFPHTDDDAEHFAIRGNFTSEAASINRKEQAGERVSALDRLLNAHLGKAVVRAGSRGVSFIWQEGSPNSDIGSRGVEGVSPTRRGSCLHRCLSAAGGSGILHWGRVVGSTGLLPPSTTLGRQFSEQSSERWRATAVREGKVTEGRKSGTVVAVALNPRGDVDVNLAISAMSGASDSHDCSNVSPAAFVTASFITPWRLMGTVPLGEVWPSCLAGQGWGGTRMVRADCGRGAQLWRTFLEELLVAESAGVVSLPQKLFGCDALPSRGDARQALTVALLVPVSSECAVCFSAERLAATPAGEHETSPGPVATAQQQVLPEVCESASIDTLSSAADERGASGFASGDVLAAGRSCDGLMRAELALTRRGVEVGLAMQEASLARKRRRQAKNVHGKGARGRNNSGSSIASAEDRGPRSVLLSQRGSGSLCFTAEGASGDGAAYDFRQWRLETASVTSHGSASPIGYRLFGTLGGAEDDEQMSSTGSGSGPKRALYQALEDVSSRSSSLGPDADSLSTLEVKEGGGCSAGTAVHRLDGDSTVSTSGQQSPAVDDAREAGAGLLGVADAGKGELPLSLMCEPALACLPGLALPVELVALAERCARSNRSMAATAVVATVAVSAAGGTCFGTDPDNQSQSAAGPQRIGMRQKFVDAVRSAERIRRTAAAATSVPAAANAGIAEEGLPAAGYVPDVRVPSRDQTTAPEAHAVGREKTQGENQGSLVEGDGAGTLEGARPFEGGVSRAVAGLQMQYREIVEGGHRSPVEFVICAVPEAIRDMTDGGKEPASVGHPDDDRHVRAAQVLAAVVGGLTSTPEELSSKHRANRSAGTSGTGTGAGATPSTVAAKPALQKIRDYQLQALLLCQLNTLAMDLPETPASLAAFSSLAAGEMRKGKKGKGKKGKGKKRRREGGKTDEPGAPTRPSDPLPDCRRTRLVDYLQPISTMLDARTVTNLPPLDDSSNGGGGSNVGCKTRGFQSRAFDGTLADFMGLALVEHFASRLPRTLGALFEDFECHPPDALTAALTGAPTSASCAATGGAVAVGSETGGGPSKETDAVFAGAPAFVKELSAAGSTAKNDRAGASSNGSSTAGILLSDRTAMSHNHFKMSGVLNGFREVKIKGHMAAGGGLRPRVLGRVSGNDQGGGDADESAPSGENGVWRTSNGGGESRRTARSRATRDSKQAADSGKIQQSPAAKPLPAVGIRQSPRLRRKRPNGDADEESGVLDETQKQRSASGSKRPLLLAASTTAASVAVTPSRRRCKGTAAPGGGIPRARAGVLVGETPRKRLGAGVAAARSSRRALRTVGTVGGAASSAVAQSPPCKSSKKVPEEANIPASPNLPMGSPAAGPTKRQCRTEATGHSSPTEGLFVAESPGVSTGSACRRGRAGWAAGMEGDGVSRQLMAESGSPAGRRPGAVVPGTPA